MSNHTKAIHLKNPDENSIFAVACGNRSSIYGLEMTDNVSKVTCLRCKTARLLALQKTKLDKRKRTDNPEMMKELILKCGTAVPKSEASH